VAIYNLHAPPHFKFMVSQTRILTWAVPSKSFSILESAEKRSGIHRQWNTSNQVYSCWNAAIVLWIRGMKVVWQRRQHRTPGLREVCSGRIRVKFQVEKKHCWLKSWYWIWALILGITSSSSMLGTHSAPSGCLRDCTFFFLGHYCTNKQGFFSK